MSGTNTGRVNSSVILPPLCTNFFLQSFLYLIGCTHQTMVAITGTHPGTANCLCVQPSESSSRRLRAQVDGMTHLLKGQQEGDRSGRVYLAPKTQANQCCLEQSSQTRTHSTGLMREYNSNCASPGPTSAKNSLQSQQSRCPARMTPDTEESKVHIPTMIKSK